MRPVQAIGTLSLLFIASTANAGIFGLGDTGAYSSVTWGNGRINGSDAGDYKLMRWRTFEIRLGHDIAVFGGDRPSNASSVLRIDVIHYNEGHPDNNHRDGFAGQLVYSARLNRDFTTEIGTGVYSSMNTTTINGIQYDSARRGVLSTAALLMTPAWLAPGHFRLAFNHAWMSDTFRSNSVQFGFGRHFTDPPPYSNGTTPSSGRIWAGGAWERAITNMSGTDGASGMSVEVRREAGALAASATYLREGDDGRRVDRRGEAVQLWLVQPLVPSVTASFGGGPYLAQNRYEDDRRRLEGLYTLQFDYKHDPSDRIRFFYSFSRVKTYAQMNDRDLHHVGVLFAFGR